MKERVFKLALQSIMKDNVYDRVIRKRKKGRLDDKNLYKVAVNQENIFKQKQERKNK